MAKSLMETYLPRSSVKVVLNLFGITFKQTFYQFTGTGFHDGIGLKVIQNFISETVSYFFIRNVQTVLITFLDERICGSKVKYPV